MLWFIRKLIETRDIANEAYNSDPYAIKLFVGTLTLGWGLWLLLPASTYQASPNSFVLLNAFIREDVLGIILTFLGWYYLRLVTRRQHKKVRHELLFVLMVLWLFIDSLLAGANFWATGTITYSIVFIFALWAYIRSR